MGHGGATRRFLKGDTPYERLSQRLSRPIAASLLTDVLGTCGVPASPLTDVMEIRRRMDYRSNYSRRKNAQLKPQAEA